MQLKINFFKFTIMTWEEYQKLKREKWKKGIN